MTNQNNPKEPHRSYSRPADSSLEAYKQWIRGLTRALGGRDDLTDADLEKGWRSFWEAAGNGRRREVAKPERELLATGNFVIMPDDITGIGIVGCFSPEDEEGGHD